MSDSDNKETKWKDYLLSSGLPLEYEVKKFFEIKDCDSRFDFGYFRPGPDSRYIERSFDIEASYVKPYDFFEIFLECKYCKPGKKWLFVPYKYFGEKPSNISFLHPIDHFCESRHFLLEYKYPKEFAPLCSKGVQISNTDADSNVIINAVSQLSYAMAGQIADGMLHQYENLLTVPNVIFYYVPIIITTADLYLLNDTATMDDIMSKDDISSIATKHKILLHKPTVSSELEQHSLNVFNSFIETYGEDKLNSKLRRSNGIKFQCELLSRDVPESIVIIQHDPTYEGLNTLFNLFDDVVSPSEETKEMIRQNDEQNQKSYAAFLSKLAARRNENKNK